MKFEPAEIDAIAEAVAERLTRHQDAGRAIDGNQIGYREAEAAALLSVPQHVLRDARLRHEITARKVGKCFVYSRAALIEFLDDHP